MRIDRNQCRVVICENHWFRRHPNIFNVHRIPLGQTDAVLPRPKIDKPLAVWCDEWKRLRLCTHPLFSRLTQARYVLLLPFRLDDSNG